MSQTFPAQARLHCPSDYAAALRGQRIARGALFVVLRPKTPAQAPARLGMIVPKRFARRAVTRNAIKRVVREAFRNQRLNLPAGDWVFRLVRAPAPASLTTLKRQVRQEADRLLGQIIDRA